jgi:hypothetical protein
MGWEQLMVNIFFLLRNLLMLCFTWKFGAPYLVSSAYSTATEIKLAEREAFMVN